MFRIFTRHILILYFPVWLIATLGKLRNLRSRRPWPEQTEWIESTSVPEMRFGCGGDIACNPSADTTVTRPHIFASSASWSLCPSSVTTMGGLRRSPGRLSLGGCTAIFIWYGDSLFSALFATIARVGGFLVSAPPALFFAFRGAVVNIFEVFSLRGFAVVWVPLSASLVLSVLVSSFLNKFSLFDRRTWSAFHFSLSLLAKVPGQTVCPLKRQ